MIQLFRYLRPFVAGMVCVVMLVLLQSLADLGLPTMMADIVDKGIARGDIGLIWRTGGLMLLVALGGTATAIVAAFMSARISAGFGKRLRSMVFSHVEGFSLHEFDRFSVASLITRTTNDITQVQMVILMALRMAVFAPMMCIGGIIMAVSMDRGLSVTLAAVLPAMGLALAVVITRGMPLFKAMQAKLDRLNQVAREGLTGVRVIRAFNRTDLEERRFDEASRDLTATAIRANRLMAALMPASMLVLNFTTIAIIWIGSHRVDAGSLEIGRLMAFVQYSLQILFSLIMLSVIFVMLPRASASAERINEVLCTDPTIRDTGSPRRPERCGGAIEFQGVTFRYPGAQQPAIRDVSFRANPGEVTAIIGGTGSGKSTLVNLILRFYDVDSGRILVDGVDIRHMTQQDLRAAIGLVPQKAVLFTGTVADNIRYGKPDATAEEIRQAAETAQAMEFVTATKDGLDSLISQGGTNLSGGQKQRLAIARALVRRPQIYIFDDSFSALDYKTDAALRAALKKETADTTVLIVAQRVSTVMDADRIIVLDEGAVVGNGTHRELMKGCEVYREIVSSQLSEEEIA
ncbi:MAG: ABC transporter ATP-binding protein [Ignavibacteriales bacterium]